MIGRSVTGRTRGRDTRENAGMSSENYVRIIMAENLRFLGEGLSTQGKPGAKARPEGVVDAHAVKNQQPPKLLSTGTQEHRWAPPMVEWGEAGPSGSGRERK